ncbi:MAG: hypothetical protein A3A33_04395 [Candidatus Yanofskybacteria bacterium RIFCSPLOWO2_01_FULL_49_25]|uniref:Uncharacterized protein n=1 Tax=Candidatus Yanofskybacteria bacterium RIFCSPLOWO2_01_FULL_49_25 TaxID=1802701 RepID=A0A1F8GWC6_9BACT|nr:MAG: hypothetical protein A3A33_04395 [Candidatus Yanofskybacteria bacterium RIFCSPLOWO2_01_FULL_49_25]
MEPWPSHEHEDRMRELDAQSKREREHAEYMMRRCGEPWSGALEQRFQALGLGKDPKYRFIFGSLGFPLAATELDQLGHLAKAAVDFIARADEWYRRQVPQKGGSWWISLLQSGIPRDYIPLSLGEQLPVTMMIDTVYTRDGWKIVEIDATNRNAMGYPPLLRALYNLPCIWQGITELYRTGGWYGTTQIMASHHRFYEPYFRWFLNRISGVFVSEEHSLRSWLDGCDVSSVKLLDLPVLNRSADIHGRLVALAEQVPVAIPPKHHLSNKATLSLPWEVEQFRNHPVTEFLPPTRLIHRGASMPTCDFFLKLVQSGGAHGTFSNDRGRFHQFAQNKRAQAVWQETLPIAARPIKFFTEQGLKNDDFFVRLSLFVTPAGEIVDADVTGSKQAIVHGGVQSIMTVPVRE